MKMILVSAVALIDRDGRVLLAQRPKGKSMAGLWEFPGGKVDPGESDEAALVRELQEELSVVVLVHEYLGESVHDDGRGPLTLVAYRCTIESGELTLTDHDAVRYVHPDEFGEYEFAPADVPLLAAISERASCT